MAISLAMNSTFLDVTTRIPPHVKLVAVSKTYFDDAIKPVLDLGQRVFGENRVQEAKQKWPNLRKIYAGIELHLIGPLQSNKAAEAVALFDVIQTVDRLKIAESLAEECKRQNLTRQFYIQVNTGLEPQKAGIHPDDADSFIVHCRDQLGLDVVGLMCIPPAEEDPRHHFQILRSLALRHGLPQLSMGMSSDFEIAIEEGATVVRVGSAIFGKR
jgi:pyridoxal phosphate enzyme (YggS family)